MAVPTTRTKPNNYLHGAREFGTMHGLKDSVGDNTLELRKHLVFDEGGVIIWNAKLEFLFSWLECTFENIWNSNQAMLRRPLEVARLCLGQMENQFHHGRCPVLRSLSTWKSKDGREFQISLVRGRT